MASPLLASLGDDAMDDDDLTSLLTRAKTAGLAHERELALLAGRSAIARTTDNFDGSDVDVSSSAAQDWFRHALSGALDAQESRECRRCVGKDSD